MTLVKDRPRSAETRKPKRKLAGTTRLLALVLLVATCWGALWITTPSPSGNPVLTSTSPGNTETVKSPDEVRLTFDRPVPAGLATIRIINPPGDQVVFDRPVHPDGRADTISVPMPKMRYEGTYTVAWTLPSSQLEPISGTFTFDVFSPVSPRGVPEIETTHDTAVSVFYTTFLIASIVAVALLVGAVFFAAAIWPSGARSASVRRLIMYAWLGFVVATLGVLASFGPYAAWAPAADALDPRLLSGAVESNGGGALLARLAVLVPATFGLVQLMTSEPAGTLRQRCWRGGAVLACGGALLATWTFADPRSPEDPSPLALTLDIALLGAVAVSIGGLAMLWLLLRSSDRAAPLVVVPRFVRAAIVCAGMLGAAGVYQAWAHVHSLDSLTTSHGWLLAGLLALIALLAVAVLLSRFWLLRQCSELPAGDTSRRKKRVPPRTELRRFRRLIASTAGGAALVVSATATLVATQPPQSAHAQEPAEPAPAAIRQQAPPTWFRLGTDAPGGRGAVQLVLAPTAAGPGQVHLDSYISVLDQNGLSKKDVVVTAVINRPDGTAGSVPVPLSHAGPGYSIGSATIPSRGGWELALTLRTADGKQQTLTKPVEVR